MKVSASENLGGEKSASSVLVVAGEASGDEHAAGVVEALKNDRPDVRVFGMGGTKLRQAGMDTVVDSEKSASVMGLAELTGSIGHLYHGYKKLLREIDRHKPNVAVLVDFPDFNLLLARALYRRKVPVLYFISPQLWAWRTSRVKTIRKYVCKVLPIFPFESAFYLNHGVDAQFVGHPFLDREPLGNSRVEFLSQIGLDPQRPVVAILPGSRRSEVELLLKPMLYGFARLRKGRPGLQAVIPVARTLDYDLVKAVAASVEGVKVIRAQARETLSAADVAVVASGTITVEAAIARVPFVVVYKLQPFTYRIGKILVKGVKNFAMANLIAGKKIVEELLQDEVSEERIAAELERLLGDTKLREEISRELDKVTQRLAFETKSGGTVGARVAQEVGFYLGGQAADRHSARQSYRANG